MSPPGLLSRRRLLYSSGLLALSSAACRPAAAPAAPAFLAREVRPVQRVLGGVATTDGAGVRLTRVIGQPALRHLDPFLMLDRFHADDPGAYIAGFPDHPHRGFETVTVMLEGRMRHRDSRGNSGLISGGGAQWMTAGRGIIHSEMPEQEQGLMSGMQLWLNLPAAEKLCPAAYQDLQPAQVAEASLSRAGSRARVIAGRLDGLTGPVRERPTQPQLVTVSLADDAPFTLETPRGHTAFAFVAGGEVQVGPEDRFVTVREGDVALLGPGTHLRVRAPSRRSEVLLAAARPLNERIVQYGPFVMNSEAEIQQAFADYRAGVLDRG
jgi:redox-sensitive bicupin YhaK (pirin superfamily)